MRLERVLKELEEKGDAACSEVDLMNGYDAEFCKKLVSNHIAYYEDNLKSQGGAQFKLGVF